MNSYQDKLTTAQDALSRTVKNLDSIANDIIPIYEFLKCSSGHVKALAQIERRVTSQLSEPYPCTACNGGEKLLVEILGIINSVKE
jgi:hypothetical protein